MNNAMTCPYINLHCVCGLLQTCTCAADILSVYYTIGCYTLSILYHWLLHSQYTVPLVVILSVYYTIGCYTLSILYHWLLYSQYTIPLVVILSVYYTIGCCNTGLFITVVLDIPG